MKKIISLFSVFVVASFCIVIYTSNHNNSNKTEDEPIKSEQLIMRSWADYPYYSDINELSNRATDVITGEIVDERTEMIDTSVNPDTNSKGRLYTVYTVLVRDVYKGRYTVGENIEIMQRGGETEEIIYYSTDKIDLNHGVGYVFFVKSHDNIPATFLTPMQSVYFMDNRSGKSANEPLECVDSSNHVPLTYNDLLSLKNNNQRIE